MKNLVLVALRQQAVFIPEAAAIASPRRLSGPVGVLVANLARLGYGVSEPLLDALGATKPSYHVQLLTTFREVMGVNKNWTPLVKGWDTPTGESVTDHLITFFVNTFKGRGPVLPCGHVIPDNTFPLERYNGCPFCGTPFTFGKIEHYGQGSKLKILELWTETDLNAFLCTLLESKTALDANQTDSLQKLLAELSLPAVSVAMKETRVVVIDALLAHQRGTQAQALFDSPTDVLRYLWYKHTGFLQLIEPKTIVKRQAKNHLGHPRDHSAQARFATAAALKLKYNRPMGYTVATWLNGLDLAPEKAAEMMHPKREMWVRFIRALRLAEYSQRPGFEKLKALLDVFYTEQYDVWQGRVNYYRLRMDASLTFKFLKQRPGLFARSLFANMLWFGADDTAEAFAEVIDQVPARLVFTLQQYAQNYFDPSVYRAVKPLGGVTKMVPANPLLELYDEIQLAAMQTRVEDLCVLAMTKRFARVKTNHRTMYIDPALFQMPVAIGERSDQIQDMPVALAGTRFAVVGDTVRLFMQWGTGLKAQHLDMDLSCHVAYDHGVQICSFSQLTSVGCQHSGDIRSIPNQVGTAEYIDLNLNALRQHQARFVTFTCNAYSAGSLSPNLTVGWMNSQFPMVISPTSGVAYDPSCVQHQVRITQGLVKGLVFGVLDVAAREITWLEMPFQGQVVQQLSLRGVRALLAKLNARLSVGNLLRLKAEAQGLALVDTADGADEAYTRAWATNAAAVTQLLLD